MAVSDTFIAFVVDQLAGVGEITPKRMFGGVGLYADDLFFGLLASNEMLYLKVDDTNRPDFEAAGMGPFLPYGDARDAMRYYQVPLAVLEDADELARWARKAIAVAATAPSKPRRRKAGRAARRPAKSARKPKRPSRR